MKTQVSFALVQIGQIFMQSMYGAYNLFIKIQENPSMMCDCGHGFNALNITSGNPFQVHFHETDWVKVHAGAIPIRPEQLGGCQIPTREDVETIFRARLENDGTYIGQLTNCWECGWSGRESIDSLVDALLESFTGK